MVRGWIALFALLVLLAGCRVSFTPSQDDKLPAPTAGTAEEREAVRLAAEGYLALIDSRQYAKTWESAGPVLKDMTNETLWVNTLRLARKMSLPEERKLQGFGFNTRVDNRAPEGEYVVVQYIGQEGSTTATEKMVLQRHEGQWKIIGYFVHKQVKFNAG